jgi:hypothetical protein
LFNQAGMMSGKFKGKMIVVESLMDEIAFAWQADWYRTRVKAALGNALDDYYRLWFVEKGMHTPPKDMSGGLTPGIATRAVNFGPVLQQALRDVAAWAEKGVAPAESTSYEVVDGQIHVPADAAKRGGIQPLVSVTTAGELRAEVAVGEQVKFTAVIDAPPGAGSITDAEWDFEGAGDFPMRANLEDTKRSHVEAEATYAFSKPGTYFPALKATLHRKGDAKAQHARVQNIGRMRVVVR